MDIHKEQKIPIEDIRIFWGNINNSVYVPHVSNIEKTSAGLIISHYCMMADDIIITEYPDANYIKINGTKKNLVKEFILNKLENVRLED